VAANMTLSAFAAEHRAAALLPLSAQQQTSRTPPLLSIDGINRRTDGPTDRRLPLSTVT